MSNDETIGRDLSTGECSLLMQCSQQTIIRWCEEGLTFYKIGNHRRIRLDDLVSYAKRNGIPAFDLLPEVQARLGRLADTSRSDRIFRAIERIQGHASQVEQAAPCGVRGDGTA